MSLMKWCSWKFLSFVLPWEFERWLSATIIHGPQHLLYILQRHLLPTVHPLHCLRRTVISRGKQVGNWVKILGVTFLGRWDCLFLYKPANIKKIQIRPRSLLWPLNKGRNFCAQYSWSISLKGTFQFHLEYKSTKTPNLQILISPLVCLL